MHLDRHNGPGPSLLLALSLHDKGEVWIEDSEGSEYVEHNDSWIRGERHAFHMCAVRFPSHTRLHYTCPWVEQDRVMLTAYTVNKWESITLPLQARMEDLGFVLPERRRQPPSSLHLDCIPTVLRD